MTIPKKLKIGGATYDVSILDKVCDGDAAGIIDSLELTIKIGKGKKQAMEMTLLHEIFHAINNEFKEVEIEFLTQALYQIIADNPTVFKGGVHK